MGSADPEERRLRARIVLAQYDYYRYVEPKWCEEFRKETQGYTVDPDHWAAKYYRTTSNDDDDAPEAHPAPADDGGVDVPEADSLYRYVARMCHPDKCARKWAREAFEIAAELRQRGDVDGLAALKAALDDPADEPLETLAMLRAERYVKNATSQAWFRWRERDSLLRDVLVPPDVLKERLERRNADLRAESQRLESEVKRLRRSTKDV